MNKFYSILFTIIILPVFAVPVSQAAEIVTNSAMTIRTLDNKFNNFSSLLFTDITKSSHIKSYKNINKLLETIKTHKNNNDTTTAISIIIKNINLLKNNINHKGILHFPDFLLLNNAKMAADILLAHANKESDSTVIATFYFAYAKYYFARKNWKKTIETINNLPGELTQSDYHAAILIHGIALQKLRQHRQAILLYKKIPDTSKHYASAQLNMAISNIRQDWWTDAYMIINNLLNTPETRSSNDKKDRLYTILGHLFLLKHYYRNSREIFRKVGAGSKYENKALLGLALSAASQNDYIGALNAVRLLKNKKTFALQVDEANLLVPFFYEKLRQHTTASAGYNDAIKYYQSRINNIDATMKLSPDSFLNNFSNISNSALVINKELIPAKNINFQLLSNYVRLLQDYDLYVKSSNNAKLIREHSETYSLFKNYIHKIVKQSLNRKSIQLASYMSQCRYGIARMYDNSRTKKK